METSAGTAAFYGSSLAMFHPILTPVAEDLETECFFLNIKSCPLHRHLAGVLRQLDSEAKDTQYVLNQFQVVTL